jgi:hypothetical protein
LKFDFLITEIEKLLKDEHLEEDQRIDPLPARINLTRLCVTVVKQWPK